MPTIRMTTRSSMSVKPCSSSRSLRSMLILLRIDLASCQLHGRPGVVNGGSGRGGPEPASCRQTSVSRGYQLVPEHPPPLPVQVRVGGPPLVLVMANVLPDFDVAVTT